MKTRLAAILLATVLLLSGCTPLFRRSYYSSTDHVDYTVEEDSSVLRAESYRGLVDAMLYFVNEHLSRGVVRLYNYTGDVEGDLAAACREITQEDPLTAYAVESITYEYSRIVSYYEVTVAVSFAHSQSEIDAILPLPGISSLRPLLDKAMTTFSSGLTFHLSYFSGDEETLRTMAAQAYYAAPQCAFGMPEVDVAFYPDAGPQRIIELSFRWPGDKKTLEMRSSELVAAADQFIALTPPAEGTYTPAELAGAFFLTARPADPAGAEDPYSALTGSPSTLSAQMLALELLFHRAGLDAVYVSGFSAGAESCWLIVKTGAEYSHLLWGEEGVLLLSDSAMTERGCLWRTDLYPACTGQPSPDPVSEDIAPAETGSQPE